MVALTRPDASVLVLDCAGWRPSADARLVAHLAPDEPPGNARLLADVYLADPTRGPLRLAGRAASRRAPGPPKPGGCATAPDSGALLDARGRAYAIREVSVQGAGARAALDPLPAR